MWYAGGMSPTEVLVAHRWKRYAALNGPLDAPCESADPSLCPIIPQRSVDSFWRRVDKSGPCWTWTGHVAKGKAKCGLFNIRLRPDGKAHTFNCYRLAYRLLVGPIPEGLELDHLCFNRRCVNPAHLEPVTRQENVRRRVAAQKAGLIPPNKHKPKPLTHTP